MAAVKSHELVVVRDEPWSDGRYMVFRCRRDDCDTGGSFRISPAGPAERLLRLLAEAHREAADGRR